MIDTGNTRHKQRRPAIFEANANTVAVFYTTERGVTMHGGMRRWLQQECSLCGCPP
jgi:hypothetical protein